MKQKVKNSESGHVGIGWAIILGLFLLACFALIGHNEGWLDGTVARITMYGDGVAGGLIFEEQPIASGASVAHSFMEERVPGEKASEVIDASARLLVASGEASVLVAESDKIRALTPEEERALQIENDQAEEQKRTDKILNDYLEWELEQARLDKEKAENRKQNLLYASIAAGVLLFFGFCWLVSRILHS